MKFDQPLNDVQRAMVEDTLPVARWTVRKYIASNENIVGLSLEDLHQEAYLALCGAASTYNDRHAQFSTYAVTVIHNHLIDYCRRIYSGNQNLPTLSIDAPCSADGTSNFLENASAVDDSFEEKCLSRIWVNDFLEQRKVSYTGCAKLGMQFVACAPRAYFPSAELIAKCQEIAAETGATLEFITDPMAATKGAHVIYTDVWVSMGEPDSVWQERIEDLTPYRVTMSLMNNAGDQCRFMHCLPAFHDVKTTIGKQIYDKFGIECMEVTDEVFESEKSIVFDEAENRMHTIKAVMAATL
mgnify:CR=1 FL=1